MSQDISSSYHELLDKDIPHVWIQNAVVWCFVRLSINGDYMMRLTMIFTSAVENVDLLDNLLSLGYELQSQPGITQLVSITHYINVTWASWRLKPPASRMFVQQLIQHNNKGNIIGLHNTRLCVENECCCPSTVNISNIYTARASIKKHGTTNVWPW